MSSIALGLLFLIAYQGVASAESIELTKTSYTLEVNGIELRARLITGADGSILVEDPKVVSATKSYYVPKLTNSMIGLCNLLGKSNFSTFSTRNSSSRTLQLNANSEPEHFLSPKSSQRITVIETIVCTN